MGNISPKQYLSEVKSNFGERKFNLLCETHLLEKNLNSQLYDNFNKFLRSREKRIVELIKQNTNYER